MRLEVRGKVSAVQAVAAIDYRAVEAARDRAGLFIERGIAANVVTGRQTLLRGAALQRIAKLVEPVGSHRLETGCALPVESRAATLGPVEVEQKCQPVRLDPVEMRQALDRLQILRRSSHQAEEAFVVFRNLRQREGLNQQLTERARSAHRVAARGTGARMPG